MPYTNYTSTTWKEDGTLYGATEFNNLETGIINIEKYAKYREMQYRNMANAMRKLRTGNTTTFALMGDSVFFGYNTIASTGEDDEINPTVLNTQKGDNEVTEVQYINGANVGWGNTTSTRRTKVQIPATFIETMNKLYDNNILYHDMVYTGDTAKVGYYRWNPSKSDFIICNYGINDAMATHFSTDYVGNQQEFITWYSKLIEREIENGTAFIICTPVLQTQVVSYDTDSRTVIDVYEKILFWLGELYGCPVINGNELNKNFSNRLIIDFTHFTGEGNTTVGRRMAAPFVGGDLSTPMVVTNNSFVGVKVQQDNINVSGKAFIEYTDKSPTMPTLIDNNDLYDNQTNRIAKGLGVLINYDYNVALDRQCTLYARNKAKEASTDTTSEEYSSAYEKAYSDRMTALEAKHKGDGYVSWGFYCEEDGMAVIPEMWSESGATVHMELDFGATQGSPNNIQIWKNTDEIDYEYEEPSSCDITIPENKYYGLRNYNKDQIIKITTKGWHSIRLYGVDSAKFEVYGLSFISHDRIKEA